MLPVVDETRVDVTPSPSDVSWPSSDGALLVQTVPHNVHFSEPKFTAVELYRLHHARRMHPHDAVLVASHDPSIMVGHNFSKIGKDAVGQVCKEGCSVCNAAFMQAHHRGGVSERPPKDAPMGVMDSFGPLSTPSILRLRQLSYRGHERVHHNQWFKGY